LRRNKTAAVVARPVVFAALVGYVGSSDGYHIKKNGCMKYEFMMQDGNVALTRTRPFTDQDSQSVLPLAKASQAVSSLFQSLGPYKNNASVIHQ